MGVKIQWELYMPINGFNGYKAICESLSIPDFLTSILGKGSSGILDMSSDIHGHSLGKSI
jgi:hypothetical protein